MPSDIDDSFPVDGSYTGTTQDKPLCQSTYQRVILYYVDGFDSLPFPVIQFWYIPLKAVSDTGPEKNRR